MTNKAAIQVEIPVQLAIYAITKNEVHGGWTTVRNQGNKTRPYMKPIALYLLLKAQTPESGWIQGYAKQIPELAAAFGISRRTFYEYISKLEDLKMVERKGSDLRLAGWKAIGKELYISTQQRVTIQYNLYGKFNLHLWFTALEIEDNQELQAAELWRKINRNSDTKHNLLSALTTRGYNYDDRNDRDKFIAALFMLAIKDFSKGTEVHDDIIELRSDLNRTVGSIAGAWDVTPSLVSYYKRSMVLEGIISVSKVAVMSEYSRETKHCHRNPYCHVTWNKREKQRVWFLCDQISVLRPWEHEGFLDFFLKKSAA